MQATSSLPSTVSEATPPAPKVVVTMPAYKAERTLERTVAEIPPGAADKLILVDDASPDNTAAIARGLGIDVYVHPRNRGYGGNQKTCYTMALRDGADIVVMLHPDYQYEPRAVPLLVAPIVVGHADMTFGSRFNGLGNPRDGGMPIYRYAGNRLTTVLENFMLGSHFTEMHSGMRAYTRECLLSLPFLRYSDSFVFDSQLLLDAISSGLRVVEVPIPTRYTKESSSIAVGRSLQYIAGSLVYCARQSLLRGRQGRRSPAANPGRFTRRATGSRLLRERYRTELTRLALCEWMLGQLGGYLVRGRRLLAAGAERELLLETAVRSGWSVTRPGEQADSVIVIDGLEPPVARLEQLRALRAAVDDEGLLAVAAASIDSSPEALDTVLSEAGFRIVEWTRLPPPPGELGLPSLSAYRVGDPCLVIARPCGSA